MSIIFVYSQNQKPGVMQRLIYLSLTLSLAFILINSIHGQGNIFPVKGIILNEESQSPITGVTIQDTLSGFGQISDSEGKFQLELKTLPAVIIFKHLGYFDDTLTIQNKNHYFHLTHRTEYP